MEELIEKVNNLIKSMDETKEIQELKEMNQKIMEDKSLLKDISTYNETQDEKIKERIIKNPLFREYKHKETECNLLIMKINQELKEITGKKEGCS